MAMISCRILDGPQTTNIVPDASRSLLISRVDHQEMLEWQEGGGELIEEMQAAGFTPNQVTCSILLKNLSQMSSKSDVIQVMEGLYG